MPSPSPATQRLASLSQHLSTSPNPPQTAHAMSTTAAARKPPITCHVLDTTLGKPAPSIPVTLTLHTSPSLTFSGSTNADGRVTSWSPSSPFSSETLESVFARADAGDQVYSLRFDTGEYFGGRGIKAFFPEVEVRFVVRAEQRGEQVGEHFHVPVLLGPFGYTTYRGS